MPTKKATPGFSDFERDAMKNRAKELAAEEKAKKNRAAGEKAVLDAIAEMTGSDKEIAEKIHAIMQKHAPELWPKTWYGMPAYANKDGKVICFFQAAKKFESRYATFGFQDSAKLDEGNMWPTTFALTKITAREEAKIIEMVKQAIE